MLNILAKRLKMKFYFVSLVAAILLVGCSSNTTKDNNTSTQQATAVPAAPSMSYESVLISNDSVGPFNLTPMQEGIGTAINYQARIGVMNVFEQVVDDVSATGYVSVEKVYSFGNRYVFVVSTGESGLSCPARTYAFVFDTKSESVTGKTEIDGCSESVDSLADGNKLTIKKEGQPTVIYNAEANTTSH
jgi:hypothetical protein